MIISRVFLLLSSIFPVSILHESIAGYYRPVRVAAGPITARCKFIKNASWVSDRISVIRDTIKNTLVIPTSIRDHVTYSRCKKKVYKSERLYMISL